ncbi:mitochondrial fission 1 protein isoform 2-T2 [Phaethornis superciliosus]
MDPEFDETVAIEDLLALERRFLAESRSGSVSRESQFQYSWGLIHSPYSQDVTRGVTLLKELLPRGTREEQRDCCYGLALGHYRMRDYEVALGHLQRLLAAEPQNPQGLRLRGLIRERMRRVTSSARRRRRARK